MKGLGHSIYWDHASCPVCKQTLTGITPATLNKPDNWRPDEGDFSICVHCAAFLRFETPRRLRQCTSEDLLELMNNQPDTFSMLQKMGSAAKYCVNKRR